MSEVAAALSVVVPVRNRQAPATDLVRELARQARTRPERIELVVVDDASDPPFEAPPAPGLAMHLLRSEKRLGANPARRLGFEASTAPYVHFHDSDDGLAPDWLEAVLVALPHGADVIVTRRLDETGGDFFPVAQRWWESNAALPHRVRQALALENVLGPIGGVVFARHALAGARFPPIASSQDWALYREVYAMGSPIGVAAPRARFLYRRDGKDRISASPRRKILGMATLDRGAARGPARTTLRLWRLHQFRDHAAACDRPALNRILRCTRLARWTTWLTGRLWLGLRLGRW